MAVAGRLAVSDADYFTARERAERALADGAPNAKVREIHLTLADKYASLAAREAGRAEKENNFSGQARTIS